MIGRRGPRPPSWTTIERRMREHLDALLSEPASLDPHSRSPLRDLQRGYLAWRLADLRQPPQEEDPAGQRPAPQWGLLAVVVVTLLGDIGTLFVSISVVLNASVPAALAIAAALGTAAMFLAHQVGNHLRQRRHGPDQTRTPSALAAGCAAAWLGIGTVAALLRLAAPLSTTGGFGTARTNTATIAVVLAALLFVLYAGNGLAAMTLGYRTADRPPRTVPAGGRARARRELATARETARMDVVAADAALRQAAFHCNPMATDALLTPWPPEEVRS